MAKQSVFDRTARLADGKCPIHGISMPQIDLEYITLPCGHTKPDRAIVECPRKDCNIRAFEREAFKNAVLLPEFEYLTA